MHSRHALTTAVIAIALLGATGCAVTRGQQTLSAYVDDAAITAQIKGRFADSAEVAASGIAVETLNGTVMLSGVARNADEKETAELIARRVGGVKRVRNEIAVRL
jgi:hyperosmotically inducible periplasmic protein